MGAKYYNSSMNDACTICPADIVGCPTKVIWPTAFFLKKENDFHTAFVSAIGQPTLESAHEVHLENNIYFSLNIYIYIYISILIY